MLRKIPKFLLLLLPFSSYAQNCTPEEVAYLAENQALLAEVSQGCAFSCIFSFNQDQCLLDCLSQDILVSEGCLACSVAQINCVTDNCALQCINANSQACQDCIEQNCMPNYFECIGANPNSVNEHEYDSEKLNQNAFLTVSTEGEYTVVSLSSNALISIFSFDGKLISSQLLMIGKHFLLSPQNAFIMTACDEKGQMMVVKMVKS